VDDAGSWLKVAHALVGIWFLAGLIGRWITLAQAARATEIASLQALLKLSARFERVVITGSIAVLVLGISTAVVQGRPFLGPLQGAGFDWLFVSLVLFLSVLPLVPLVFLPRGRVFDAALGDATTRGVLTEELRVAFRDPVVLAAHVYELGAMIVITVLMVAKPF
jgi:hypothetical protein